MERKMADSLGYIAPIENPLLASMDLNTIHEQMFMIDHDGLLDNFGFFASKGGEIRAEKFNIDLAKQSWELSGSVYTFMGDESAYVNKIAFQVLAKLYGGNYGAILNNCQDYCSDFRKKLE